MVLAPRGGEFQLVSSCSGGAATCGSLGDVKCQPQPLLRWLCHPPVPKPCALARPHPGSLPGSSGRPQKLGRVRRSLRPQGNPTPRLHGYLLPGRPALPPLQHASAWPSALRLTEHGSDARSRGQASLCGDGSVREAELMAFASGRRLSPATPTSFPPVFHCVFPGVRREG